MAVSPELDDKAITRGAAEADWPGRVQRLRAGKLPAMLGDGADLWLDGAHNAHGSAALAGTLERLGGRKWVLVAGALNTRPAGDFLKPLAPLVVHAVTLAIPGSDASLDAGQVAEAAASIGMPSEAATDLTDAMEKASTVAKREGADIVISGSLYLAGHVLEANGTLPD